MAHAPRLRTFLAALTLSFGVLSGGPAHAQATPDVDPVFAPGQVWMLSYGSGAGKVTRALLVGPLVLEEDGMHFYEQEVEGENEYRFHEFWYDPYDSDTEFVSVRQTLEDYETGDEAIEECVVLKPGAAKIGQVLNGRLSTAGEEAGQAFENYIARGDATGLDRCTLKRVR